MKQAPKIIFVIMIMLSAAVTLTFVAKNHRSGSIAAQTAGNSALSPSQALTLTDGDLALQVGQSHRCSARLDDGSKAQNVTWSSMDDSVLQVDGSGKITAVSPGKTEVLAVYGRNINARISVWVYKDVAAEAVRAISSLAADGSDQSMELVEDLAGRLAHCKNKPSLKIAAVLQTLADFKRPGAQGSEEASALWNALNNALASSDIRLSDQHLLRQAALAAYCQGEKSSSDLTLTFTGDCTFAYFNESDNIHHFPSVYRESGSVSYPLDYTKNVFGADDLTMINFEGTLTESRQNKDKLFFFRGEPSYVNILTSSSVEACTVENNHAYDYYSTGFNDTIDTLRNAGVRYTAFHSPAVININGLRVVMLSLCMIGTPYNNHFRAQVEKYIDQYQRNDTVIIMNVHWGEESENKPRSYQTEAAHAMIDAGVDLVIGHHPHVPQGIEEYNGHYIFYSLGNFSFSGNTSAARPQTLMVRTMFAKDGSGRPVLRRFSVIPCLTTSSGSSVNNYRPIPLYGDQGEKVIRQLLQYNSLVSGGVQSLTWNMIP